MVECVGAWQLHEHPLESATHLTVVECVGAWQLHEYPFVSVTHLSGLDFPESLDFFE